MSATGGSKSVSLETVASMVGNDGVIKETREKFIKVLHGWMNGLHSVFKEDEQLHEWVLKLEFIKQNERLGLRTRFFETRAAIVFTRTPPGEPYCEQLARVLAYAMDTVFLRDGVKMVQ